jgi:hypothetical protein
MKSFLYPLILHTLVFASQPHSLLGFRGLIFTPSTGEFPNDGESAFGYRNIKVPHTFIKWSDKTTGNHLFFGSLVLLPKFDLTGVITLAPGSHGNDGTDTYKDFALFAHIQLLEESKRFPSIMLGIHDFYSYSYYNALFLTASKSFKLNHNIQINTHLGYGVDWMDQHYGDTGPDRHDQVNHYLIGLFGGMEVLYLNYGSIIIEYDTHQINGGVRLNFLKRSQITAALLNMDTLSFGVDYRFSLL